MADFRPVANKVDAAMNSLSDARSNVTGGYWWPTLHEFLVFACLVSILAFVMYLFHYNSIQREVQKSRCYKLQDTSNSLGQYTVTAKNARNEDLYRVNYDLDAKIYSLECACPTGDVTNTFREIPIYDLANQTDRTLDKSCQCNKLLSGIGDTVYFAGYPGITRFMKEGDTTFFDEAYSTTASAIKSRASSTSRQMFRKH